MEEIDPESAAAGYISPRRDERRTGESSVVDEHVKSNPDVFLIPCLDGYLVYEPRAAHMALVVQSAGAAIRGYLSGQVLDGPERCIIEELLAAGCFRTLEDEGPVESDALGWSPTGVIFSTTQKCTLRCRYCYADGGRLDDLDIPLHIAHAAIELCIRNAARLGLRPTLGFLGEGEATLSWREFVEIIDYFRACCLQAGLEGKVSLNTNGVFPSDHASFIAQNCDSVVMSLDGLRAAHDANRILPNGQGSFDIVFARLCQLRELGATVSIRSTVSAFNLNQVSDFIRFVGENTDVKHVHLEPVFDNSRLSRLAQDVGTPTAEAFVQAFKTARRIGATFGIEVYFAGAELQQRDSFCGVAGAHNFIVTTRGIVSSCNEVLQPWDSRAAIFQYGHWDDTTQDFVISKDRVQYLSSLKVSAMRRCSGCFAKHNCGGDCPARTAGVFGSPAGDGVYYTERCYIMRELLKDNLLMTLAAAKAQPNLLGVS